jgi:hypothetical protein
LICHTRIDFAATRDSAVTVLSRVIFYKTAALLGVARHCTADGAHNIRSAVPIAKSFTRIGPRVTPNVSPTKKAKRTPCGVLA